MTPMNNPCRKQSSRLAANRLCSLAQSAGFALDYIAARLHDMES